LDLATVKWNTVSTLTPLLYSQPVRDEAITHDERHFTHIVIHI